MTGKQWVRYPLPTQRLSQAREARKQTWRDLRRGVRVRPACDNEIIDLRSYLSGRCNSVHGLEGDHLSEQGRQDMGKK